MFAEKHRGERFGAHTAEGLYLPRDKMRVYAGGQHAGRAAAQQSVFGVQTASAGAHGKNFTY